MPEYKVIETECGPMISHSRATVYDVMLTSDQGHDIFFICVNHNLTFVQAQIVLEYIEVHRKQLEKDLDEILPKMAQREQYYRQIEAEMRVKIDQQPMTPKRAAFYALKEKKSIENGLAQILSYMLANPERDGPTFGLITNGSSFIFLKLAQAETPVYGLSRRFELLNPGNELYSVLQVLKRFKELFL